MSLVADGGAAVKFVMAGEKVATLGAALDERCRESGYVFVMVDAARCRVHMPQDIFFALASAVDGPELARRVTLRILGERGFGVEGIDPADTGDVVGVVVWRRLNCSRS